jgi:hypothetical protein
MNKQLYILFGKFIDIAWYSIITVIIISLLSIISNDILIRNLTEHQYEKKMKKFSTLKLSLYTILEICIFSFFIYTLSWIFKKIPNPIAPTKYYISNLKGESDWGVTMGFILTIGKSSPYLEYNINELRHRFIKYTGIGLQIN